MKTIYSFLFAVIFLFTVAVPLFPQNGKASIKVEITGFESDKGSARILLFSDKNKDGFPDNLDKSIVKIILPIKNSQVIYEFKNMAFGNYAISVHHDENNDGELNTNLFGAPKEGVGFSNNPKFRFAPPSFEEACVSINILGLFLKIKMVN